MFTSGFFNSINSDRKYNAEQMAAIFDGLITDGIFDSIGDHFQVTPATSGLGVNIGTGRAWLNQTWSYNDTAYPVTLGAASSSLGRKDLICLKVDKSNAVRSNSLVVIAGTPAASPVEPTVTDDTTNGIYYHKLAAVTVPKGATSISAANIANYIGLSSGTPYVTGLLSSTAVDELWSQWDGEFNDWWDDIKETLNDNVVTMLLNKIDHITPKEATMNLYGFSHINPPPSGKTYAPYSTDAILNQINSLLNNLPEGYMPGDFVSSLRELDPEEWAEVKWIRAAYSGSSDSEFKAAMGMIPSDTDIDLLYYSLFGGTATDYSTTPRDALSILNSLYSINISQTAEYYNASGTLYAVPYANTIVFRSAVYVLYFTSGIQATSYNYNAVYIVKKYDSDHPDGLTVLQESMSDSMQGVYMPVTVYSDEDLAVIYLDLNSNIHVIKIDNSGVSFYKDVANRSGNFNAPKPKVIRIGNSVALLWLNTTIDGSTSASNITVPINWVVFNVTSNSATKGTTSFTLPANSQFSSALVIFSEFNVHEFGSSFIISFYRYGYRANSPSVYDFKYIIGSISNGNVIVNSSSMSGLVSTTSGYAQNMYHVPAMKFSMTTDNQPILILIYPTSTTAGDPRFTVSVYSISASGVSKISESLLSYTMLYDSADAFLAYEHNGHIRFMRVGSARSNSTNDINYGDRVTALIDIIIGTSASPIQECTIKEQYLNGTPYDIRRNFPHDSVCVLENLGRYNGIDVELHRNTVARIDSYDNYSPEQSICMAGKLFIDDVERAFNKSGYNVKYYIKLK